MKIKLTYILGTVAMVVVIGIVGWWLHQSTERQPVVIYKSTVPQQRSAKAGVTSNMTLTEKMAAKRTRDVNDVQWAIDAKLDNLDWYGPEGDPRREAFKNAILSPAFVEYRKKQNANSPSFDLTLWWDFLESQGLGSGRMAQEANFRKFFPTGEYADYEPMMEKKLAEIFLEMGHPDSTADNDIVLHTVAGMMEFRKDPANLVWMRGRFNGYNGDLDWADNIRQNAATIVANATSGRETPASIFTELEPIIETSNTTDIIEEPIDTKPLLNTNTGPEVEASFEDLEQIPQTVKEIPQTLEKIEAEYMEQLRTEIPELANKASIGNAIKERFSPQRFNTAMKTLVQYGPQEGLRRLKESDPEVAAQVERLIQPNKETD